MFKTTLDSVVIFVSTIKHKSENSRGEIKPTVITHIFVYYVFFLPNSPVFFFSFSLLCRKLSLAIFQDGLLVINSVSFSPSQNILISLSFLKNLLAGYRILVILFFQHLKLRQFYFGLHISKGKQ